MEMFTGFFYVVAAMWLFWSSAMMKTQDNLSFFFFKSIPFMLAMTAIFLALNHYGFVINVAV